MWPLTGSACFFRLAHEARIPKLDANPTLFAPPQDLHTSRATHNPALTGATRFRLKDSPEMRKRSPFSSYLAFMIPRQARRATQIREIDAIGRAFASPDNQAVAHQPGQSQPHVAQEVTDMRPRHRPQGPASRAQELSRRRRVRSLTPVFLGFHCLRRRNRRSLRRSHLKGKCPGTRIVWNQGQGGFIRSPRFCKVIGP
jgi:hypothetical protein